MMRNWLIAQEMGHYRTLKSKQLEVDLLCLDTLVMNVSHDNIDNRHFFSICKRQKSLETRLVERIIQKAKQFRALSFIITQVNVSLKKKQFQCDYHHLRSKYVKAHSSKLSVYLEDSTLDQSSVWGCSYVLSVLSIL